MIKSVHRLNSKASSHTSMHCLKFLYYPEPCSRRRNRVGIETLVIRRSIAYPGTAVRGYHKTRPLTYSSSAWNPNKYGTEKDTVMEYGA